MFHEYYSKRVILLYEWAGPLAVGGKIFFWFEDSDFIKSIIQIASEMPNHMFYNNYVTDSMIFVSKSLF